MRGQSSVQLLASVAIATLMLALVISYASSQRLLASAEPSLAPQALRHMKADLDSDYGRLFCNSGLCVNSSHSTDGVLSFSLNYHGAFFENLSNYTGSYGHLFNSSRSGILSSGLSSNLASGRLILSDSATFSNYSLSMLSGGGVSLSFNSSTASAYSLGFGCANTSEIIWSPELEASPQVNITFSAPGCSLEGKGISRAASYASAFDTECGQANVSFIKGNLYANFSYQNVSLTATIPTNNTLGVFPLLNTTTYPAPYGSFSSICPSGSEPDYPSSVTETKYGSFPVLGQRVNMVLARRSGAFDTAYLDTNGNCNFTDFTDEYFVGEGEWVALGAYAARLDAISADGSSATFTFASSGVESTLLAARLVQPIYLNK